MSGTPVIIQMFGCGKDGTETPIDVTYDPYAIDPDTVLPTKFQLDSMPLVKLPGGIFSMSGLVSHYQPQTALAGFAINPDDVTRDLPDSQGSVSFKEHRFTYTGTGSQPVYAMTSGYLFYLHSGKSNPDLLEGAAPVYGNGIDEKILVLKPLKTQQNAWAEYHPGREPVAEEMVYLDINIDLELLRPLVSKSTTELFFKKQYEAKKGVEWQGADWVSDFLLMFEEYQDWPIVIRGNEQIASTKGNPDNAQEQRLAMFFRLDANWKPSEDRVKTFFRYQQRKFALTSHAYIAKILNQPGGEGSVDLIPEKSLYGQLWGRSRIHLVADFELLNSSSDPTYHPLALDPDEHPHRLAVLKPPTEELPSYFTGYFPDNHWVTKFKVFNPLQLDLKIVPDQPINSIIVARLEGLDLEGNEDLLPVFNAAEQVVEVHVTGVIPHGFEPLLSITTTSGTVIHDLKLTFFDFKTLPVNFYRITEDSRPYDAFMNEVRLREVIAEANKILGRQSNVYVYPAEIDGEIITDHNYTPGSGNPLELGDPIPFENLEIVSSQISLPPGEKKLLALFVWNQEVIEAKGQAIGLCYPSLDHFKIAVDTKILGASATHEVLAQTLVHEIGHWISLTFFWSDQDPAVLCTTRGRHFHHSGEGDDGCQDGDWAFGYNFMKPAGGRFITVEQARVINEFASLIKP